MTDEIGDRERAQIRDDALNVLQDALEWCLTPAGWAHIAAILDGLAAGTGSGLDLGDPERRKVLKDATMRLELAGPLRIETVDSAAKPAPPEVRERLNILIDYLSGADGRDGTPGGGR